MKKFRCRGQILTGDEFGSYSRCVLKRGHKGKHRCLYDHRMRAILTWVQSNEEIDRERRELLSFKLYKAQNHVGGSISKRDKYRRWRDAILPEEKESYDRLCKEDDELWAKILESGE